MAVVFKSSAADLESLARLRAADVIRLLGVSKSTFYDGIQSGRYPKADGKDGAAVYWRKGTILAFLSGN